MTTPAVDVPSLARRLPKVELHCHVEGAARPATIADLARENGVRLPVDDPAELFRFDDLDSFLAVYGIICQSLTTAEAYRRITYEACEDAVAAGVRYREMFVSPGFATAMGVPIETLWDGMRTGLAEAHHDFDMRCRIVMDVDKPAGGDAAMTVVQFAAQQDRDLLVGVGGDSTERGVDHHEFAPAFAFAKEQGLRRTFHAGEDGPVENIRISVEELGAERIDHGFRLLDDTALTQRVADEGIALTVCPISNVVIANVIDDVSQHPFDAQRRAGVIVTINSDDPGMMQSTICDDYEQIARGFGYDLDTMEDLALGAIDVSFAPDDEKRALHARFRSEMDALRTESGLPTRFS
jgi:adenosine deaminase